MMIRFAINNSHLRYKAIFGCLACGQIVFPLSLVFISDDCLGVFIFLLGFAVWYERKE